MTKKITEEQTVTDDTQRQIDIAVAEALAKQAIENNQHMLIKLAEMFESGEDLDISALEPPADNNIQIAIDDYNELNHCDVFKTFLVGLSTFTPNPVIRGLGIDVNQPYRIYSASPIRAVMAHNHIGYIFHKNKINNDRWLDTDTLKEKLRRLDLRVGLLDGLTRLELIDYFSNAVLNSAFTKFRGVSVDNDQFGIGAELHQLLNDLVYLYEIVKNNSVLFNKASVYQDFDSLLLPHRETEQSAIQSGSFNSWEIRIKDNGYSLIKRLNQAFIKALPPTLRARLVFTRTGNNNNIKYGEISALLRKAFINIVQGTVSFSVFFEALYDLHLAQCSELEEEIKWYMGFVALFDKVDIDIPGMLEDSKERISF